MSQSPEGYSLEPSRQIVGTPDGTITVRWTAPTDSDVWVRHLNPVSADVGAAESASSEAPETFNANSKEWVLERHGRHRFELVADSEDGRVRIVRDVWRVSPARYFLFLSSLFLIVSALFLLFFTYNVHSDVPRQDELYFVGKFLSWFAAAAGLVGSVPLIGVLFGARQNLFPFDPGELMTSNVALVLFVAPGLTVSGYLGCRLVRSDQLVVRNQTGNTVVVTDEDDDEKDVRYRFPPGISKIRGNDLSTFLGHGNPGVFFGDAPDDATGLHIPMPNVVPVERADGLVYSLRCSSVLEATYPTMADADFDIALEGARYAEASRGAGFREDRNHGAKWYRFENENCRSAGTMPWKDAKLRLTYRRDGEITHTFVRRFGETDTVQHGPRRRRVEVGWNRDEIAAARYKITVPWEEQISVEIRGEQFSSMGRCVEKVEQQYGPDGRACRVLWPLRSSDDGERPVWKVPPTNERKEDQSFQMRFDANLHDVRRQVMAHSPSNIRRVKLWVGAAERQNARLILRSNPSLNGGRLFHLERDLSTTSNSASDGIVEVYIPFWLPERSLQARVEWPNHASTWHAIAFEDLEGKKREAIAEVEWGKRGVRIDGDVLHWSPRRLEAIRTSPGLEYVFHEAEPVRKKKDAWLLTLPPYVKLAGEVAVFDVGAANSAQCSRIKATSGDGFRFSVPFPCER